MKSHYFGAKVCSAIRICSIKRLIVILLIFPLMEVSFAATYTLYPIEEGHVDSR